MTSTTATTNIVTALAVTRHESGCGYSFRVWYTITCSYAPQSARKPLVATNLTGPQLDRMVAKFGATQHVANGLARYAGGLHRDPETLAVTVDDVTVAAWAKARIPWTV